MMFNHSTLGYNSLVSRLSATTWSHNLRPHMLELTIHNIMSVNCSLCGSFLSLCASNYEQSFSKRLDDMDLTDPEGLAKDFPHQPNYEALCKSAQNGCHICVFLRLIIDRGLPGDLMRYAVDPEEALLPIKLSQTSTDWYSIHTAGICISVGVPCHPTCTVVGAGPKPRVITTQLHHRCF